MEPMPTISEQEVNLQTLVPESARRFLKGRAAEAGLSIGEYITTLLLQHTDYIQPKPEATPSTKG